MLLQETILATLKSVKPRLEREYGVKELALFGSYSRETATGGKGDIDIMVDFFRPIGIRFVDLADELEEILHHKVDLVSRKGIKPQYFKAIEPDLIYVM